MVDEQTRILSRDYDFTLFTEAILVDPPAWLTVRVVKPWMARLVPIPRTEFHRALESFDLIHCHDSFAYIVEAAKVGKPLVVTSYGNCPAAYRSGFRDKLEYYVSEPLYGRAYRRADQVVAISVSLRNWLKDRYGIEADLNYLGADLARFSPDASTPREPAFLYVGQLSRRKGIRALLAGFAQFRLRHPRHTLWLAGFGEYAHSLRRQAPPGVQLLGFISEEELIDRYRRANAFVTASHWEGFGLPLIEALATGTPVVARDGSAMAELVRESACGTLFSGDASIARALEESLSIEGGARATAFASCFTWDANATRLAHTYDSLMHTS